MADRSRLRSSLALCGVGVVAALVGGGAILSDVGKSVRSVAAAYHYGPPLAVADLADGRRMFQWEMRASMVLSHRATPYAGIDVYAPPGAPLPAAPDAKALPDCIYTLWAKWAADKTDWLITQYKKPDLSCL